MKTDVLKDTFRLMTIAVMGIALLLVVVNEDTKIIIFMLWTALLFSQIALGFSDKQIKRLREPKPTGKDVVIAIDNHLEEIDYGRLLDAKGVMQMKIEGMKVIYNPCTNLVTFLTHSGVMMQCEIPEDWSFARILKFMGDLVKSDKVIK